MKSEKAKRLKDLAAENLLLEALLAEAHSFAWRRLHDHKEVRPRSSPGYASPEQHTAEQTIHPRLPLALAQKFGGPHV